MDFVASVLKCHYQSCIYYSTQTHNSNYLSFTSWTTRHMHRKVATNLKRFVHVVINIMNDRNDYNSWIWCRIYVCVFFSSICPPMLHAPTFLVLGFIKDDIHMQNMQKYMCKGKKGWIRSKNVPWRTPFWNSHSNEF